MTGQEKEQDKVPTFDDVQQRALDGILAIWAGLTPTMRVDILDELIELYCPHCGYPQPETKWARCQCWRDE